MTTPREAGWALEPLALHEVQEVGVILSLSVHSTFVAVGEFARGDQEHVETPLLFAIRQAQIAGSRWAILAHNHPSGDVTPSDADLALWKEARERFACSGLTLLDHLVIGRGQFYSCAWSAYWRVR